MCEQSGIEVKRRWCQIYRTRNSAKTNGVYIIALVLRIINFALRFFHGLLRTKGFRYAMPVVSEMGRCETETAPKLYCRHRLIGTRMHEMWNGIHLKNYDGNDEGDGKRNKKKTIFFVGSQNCSAEFRVCVWSDEVENRKYCGICGFGVLKSKLMEVPEMQINDDHTHTTPSTIKRSIPPYTSKSMPMELNKHWPTK